MSAADEYINTTSKVYNNISRLENSNTRAKTTYDTIDAYRSVMGNKMDAPLTQETFYETINKPDGKITVDEQDFTAKRLTDSLANGKTEGSYEDYLKAYTSSSEYVSNYGEAARSNKRGKFEEELGSFLVQWQKEKGFTGASGEGSFRNKQEYKNLR
jgi:hypothetical protein